MAADETCDDEMNDHVRHHYDDQMNAVAFDASWNQAVLGRWNYYLESELLNRKRKESHIRR